MRARTSTSINRANLAETEAGAGQDGNGIANDVDAAPALLTQAAAADTSAEVYYTELRLRISDLLQQGTRKATAEVLKAGIYCLEGVVQRSLCGYGRQPWQQLACYLNRPTLHHTCSCILM